MDNDDEEEEENKVNVELNAKYTMVIIIEVVSAKNFYFSSCVHLTFTKT
jgi:hypothetical protein